MPSPLSLSHLKDQLIFPGSLIKSTQEDLARIYEEATILSCSTPSGYQMGLLSSLKEATSQPLPIAPESLYLLYFYGNGTSLQNSRFEFIRFQQLGLNVLFPEYLGYGMSSGIASEFGCYEVADVAYRYLTAKLHIPPSQIIVGGWSLGAAVAIDLVVRKPVAGLVVLSAFTSIIDQAHAMLPWIPKTMLQLLVKERFDNLGKFHQIKCPIFLSHGTEDELVPFTMAEQLKSTISDQRLVTFLPIQRSGHNDIFDFPLLWRGIEDFIHVLQATK
jgi:pimeloyl-ACP methyl ester carboxylesterase